MNVFLSFYEIYLYHSICLINYVILHQQFKDDYKEQNENGKILSILKNYCGTSFKD
jgi:hypothetical protein